MKKRLYVDIDGTLAEFKVVDTLETLYEQGYFLNLKPNENVVEAIKLIVAENDDIEVFIMSSILSDSRYALDEKNAWLNKYLPEIDKEHRIFPPCGRDKKEYVSDGIKQDDFLLDDYSHNLTLWEPPGRGIKIMNGINGTKGSWISDKISIEKSGEEIANNIINIVHGVCHYYDESFNNKTEYWKVEDVYLTHDGYARFDLKLHDMSLGYPSDFKVSGLIRIYDENKKNANRVLNVDTYGLAHPILRKEWRQIEDCIMETSQKVLEQNAIGSCGVMKGRKGR